MWRESSSEHAVALGLPFDLVVVVKVTFNCSSSPNITENKTKT